MLLATQTGWCSATSSYEAAKKLSISDQFETENFTFLLYDDLIAEDFLDIAKALEGNYDRIVSSLVPKPKSVPRTYVHLFGDKETWLKINPMMPDGGGTVTREYGTDNIWMFVWDDQEFEQFIKRLQKNIKKEIDAEQIRLFLNLKLNLVHEFSHLVMISVDQRVGNNPRWLWESVALYEAKQQLNPIKNGYSLDEAQRPFSELEISFHLYMIGYHITDYVVENWGIESVRKLIKTQGDTLQVLNLSLEEFEKSFWRYLGCKYYEEGLCRE